MQSGSTPRIQDQFENIAPPTADQLTYQIQQLVLQGTITPEQAQAALADPSTLASITDDPSLKQAQQAALAGLQEVSDSGGMTDADKANLAQVATGEATQSKGARDAIIQSMEARGLGGSGTSLLAQLTNQQNAATNQSQKDMSITSQAQARALQALQDAATSAGNIRSQDFNEASAKANAQDAISKFNAQQQQQTNLTNTATNNAAQQANLAAKQNVADTNANLQTQQNAQKAQVTQQRFNNAITKAGGSSGVATNNANNAGKDSQNAANATNQTAGTVLSTAALLAMSDERQKEDIEDFDPSDFLDKITSVKYKYKNPAYGEGERYGTTAQDLEKSDVGATMVKDTPEGKMIDASQATGPILASLSDLHNRLKKIEGN